MYLFLNIKPLFCIATVFFISFFCFSLIFFTFYFDYWFNFY